MLRQKKTSDSGNIDLSMPGGALDSNPTSYRSVLRGLSLTQLASASYARSLRTLLISSGVDRMHLALDVCRACRIEVEPVFASWGLSLLRVGKLSEAREKFGGCLKMLMEKERKISMKSKAKSDAHVLPSARNNSEIEEHHRVRVEIVDKIVQILKIPSLDQKISSCCRINKLTSRIKFWTRKHLASLTE